ncbi:MAG: ribosome biogenesis GTPase Der [Verrucomicrobia bacterium]|nr:ribosome biogenesis GTPase Der [Verrucomicrobiota bacterium]
MSGLIAIVGRPNVGKSALFNRIVRKRIAIVHDMPGVTRDRVTAEAEWRGKPFTLVDTGGIGLLRGEKADDVITRAAFDQVQIAIDSANVIVLVVNVQEGIVPLDREVSQRLRQSGKPVLVAVNKVDTAKAESGVPEFAELGFEKLFPVTAIHGEGIETLMNEASKYLPLPEATPEPEPELVPETSGEPADENAPKLRPRRHGPLKIAIVGRPNVGKSSIINSLTNSTRVIVSPIPGTTRDSVDVPFEVETDGVRQKYILIDTAGLRKSRRVDDSVEFFSVKRTEDSIERCDIAVLVIDAVAGIGEQDKKIADIIVEQRRACIVVINKWDLVADSVREAREEEIAKRVAKKRTEGQDKMMTTLGEFGQWVQERLFFLDYAPVIFTSAQTGFHLDRLLEAVRYVAAQLQQKVPTAILNRTLHSAVERRQPVSDMGHRLKFYYATQVREAPPTFLLFVNRDEMLSDQYKKYLADQMRAAFGYEGCPIIIVPKARPKTIEPVRKFNPGRKPTATRGGQRSGEKSERTSSRSSRPEGGKPVATSSPAGGPKPGPSRGGKGGRNEKPRRRSGKGRAAARGFRK